MPTRTWLDRWDAQQQTYLPDREERFDVMLDVVAQVAGSGARVLDLACGPASLGRRVLRRFPDAQVVGIDADPVLLELARRDAPAGLQLVDADLRAAGWSELLPPGPYDAILTTTALHWLHPADLAHIYRTCGSLLREGGVLLNGDHLRESVTPRLSALAAGLDAVRAHRVGSRAGDRAGEDWSQWWAAIGRDPEFAESMAERTQRSFDHPEDSEISLEVHVTALRDAGFAEAGVLWRHGTDAVLGAVR